MARPPKYTDTDKPVSVSLRIPRDVYDQAQHHARMRRMTLTELIVEGLRLRLETPLDPRDIVVSQNDTVMHELQAMIDARIKAILAAQTIITPAPARVPLAAPSVDEQQHSNAVMQDNVSEPQRKRGRPGILRQPILDLLRQHPEGLTGVEIKVHLGTDKHLGDTLTGMKRQHVVRTEGTGYALRYFAKTELPS